VSQAKRATRTIPATDTSSVWVAPAKRWWPPLVRPERSHRLPRTGTSAGVRLRDLIQGPRLAIPRASCDCRQRDSACDGRTWWGASHRERRLSHLRAAHDRGCPMLGRQHQGPARRWHHDGSIDPNTSQGFFAFMRASRALARATARVTETRRTEDYNPRHQRPTGSSAIS
jgi:hypothetical protein